MEDEVLYKNKNWLYEHYINQKLSSTKIAKICNCSDSTIRTWIKKFNIKMRTKSEAFSGALHPFFGKKDRIYQRKSLVVTTLCMEKKFQMKHVEKFPKAVEVESIQLKQKKKSIHKYRQKIKYKQKGNIRALLINFGMYSTTTRLIRY